nr:Translational initiation factor [Paeonia suffruticosa]
MKEQNKTGFKYLKISQRYSLDKENLLCFRKKIRHSFIRIPARRGIQSKLP